MAHRTYNGRMNVREAIRFLESFVDMERDPGASKSPPMNLASMRSLLRRLGDPQEGRETVHVTGTNGKGSVSAMIEGILRAGGERTALFTSPHLHSYGERIRIDGEPVSMAELAEGLSAIRPAVEAEQESAGGQVSTFGVLVALFHWLARERLGDGGWQVVEVGLGGSFDATNVYGGAEIAVITPIALDHTAILGDTTVAIATDKAGIIGPGSTCVLAPQPDPAVTQVVRERCREAGAELRLVDEEWSTDVLERYVFGQSFLLHGRDGSRELRTPLLGGHQVGNAATAVAVAVELRARGAAIDEEAISGGIARTRVPGRLEVMGQRPLVVADGAHNPAAAAALAEALREYLEWRRCFFVLGTMEGKDLRGIAYKLAGLASGVWCCGLDSRRARDPAEMAAELAPLTPHVEVARSVAEGIAQAKQRAEDADLVCVTGSLYAVAAARSALLGESVTGR